MINGYMTVKEAAEERGLSERAVKMHPCIFVCSNDSENEAEGK